MRSDLRKNPLRSMGRYWLTMADSAAFTLVSTAIGVANELRQELADQAALPTRQNAADLAVVLLTAAESGWGKGKAAQLVSQIVDMGGPAQAVRGKVFLLVRNAMAKLPLVLWAQDKHGARRELIEELTRQLNFFQVEMTTHPSREEMREREWRGQVAALRKNESRQRR
jgi:hypothetical protein